MKIFKYTLALIDAQDIYLPSSAQILTIQTQYETPQLWALVDPDVVVSQARTILIFGAGNEITEDIQRLKYISTFQLARGRLIFHAFELSPEAA